MQSILKFQKSRWTVSSKLLVEHRVEFCEVFGTLSDMIGCCNKKQLLIRNSLSSVNFPIYSRLFRGYTDNNYWLVCFMDVGTETGRICQIASQALTKCSTALCNAFAYEHTFGSLYIHIYLSWQEENEKQEEEKGSIVWCSPHTC